jgi:hypothetical protein
MTRPSRRFASARTYSRLGPCYPMTRPTTARPTSCTNASQGFSLASKSFGGKRCAPNPRRRPRLWSSLLNCNLRPMGATDETAAQRIIDRQARRARAPGRGLGTTDTPAAGRPPMMAAAAHRTRAWVSVQVEATEGAVQLTLAPPARQVPTLGARLRKMAMLATPRSRARVSLTAGAGGRADKAILASWARAGALCA